MNASRREAPTLASNGVCKVDPLEHQPELGGFDLDVRRPRGDVVGEVKSASGELFSKDDVARPVPEQDPDLIAAPIPKHEEVPAERIVAEPRSHRRRQAIEALAEIDRLRRDVHADRRRQRQHAAEPEATTRTRSRSAVSNPEGTRTTRPLGSTISIAAVLGRAVAMPTTRTGRKSSGDGLGDDAGTVGKVRSFHRHQTSRCATRCSRAAKAAALRPLASHRATRSAHSARLAIEANG
jgi:hypothetical protein